jgi:signal transduction histidine kinase
VDGRIHLITSDNGAGFDTRKPRTGGSIGLDNVRDRLDAFFEGKASLTIESRTPTGTAATVVFPEGAA